VVVTPNDEIAVARYVSLATRRKDGREVLTPVWIATDAGAHYVFSAPNVGKVKRIRANPRVRVAKCNARGKDLGNWYEGNARLITADPALVARAYRALHAKYGWQMWLGGFFSKLAGRYAQREFIEITL
jgi:uncharacterized protein